jgi:hypothetical protein
MEIHVEVLVLHGVASSEAAGDATDAKTPSELLAIQGASGVRSVAGKDGRYELSYRLQVEYPAESVIASIRAAVAPDRWQPLERDWLNPEQARRPSDWRDSTDGTKNPNTMVHVWTAQWRDLPGSVLVYSLSYESAVQVPQSRTSVPDNNTLRVRGLFFPAPVVEEMRKQLGITEPLQ